MMGILLSPLLLSPLSELSMMGILLSPLSELSMMGILLSSVSPLSELSNPLLIALLICLMISICESFRKVSLTSNSSGMLIVFIVRFDSWSFRSSVGRVSLRH